MSSPFDRPAPPGDQFDCASHVGALLVIDVQEHVKNIRTKVSSDPQDAIRGHVYVISPQGTVAEQFINTLLFPRMLVARLQQSLGRKVLGVLTGQPGVQRDGRNVPYDLDDPSDPMEAAAVRAMSAHAAQQIAPAQQAWGPQPATQQTGWGQAAPSAPPWGQQQPPAGPPAGWGQPAQQSQPGGWQQPAQQQGPPPGWGQQPAASPTPQEAYAIQAYAQAQQPAQQQISVPQQPQQGPWGQQPPQQERPPWETDQAQQPAPSWGGQQ